MHAMPKMQALHHKRGILGGCTVFVQQLHSQIPSVYSGLGFGFSVFVDLRKGIRKLILALPVLFC